MVRLSFILSFSFCAWALAGTPALKTHCTPHQVYRGQWTHCQYDLEADTEFVEVEVSKFPEFSGFWANNLTLHQGPLRLRYISNHRFQTTLGEYDLFPMVGRAELRMDPMKVVFKAGQSQLTLSSSEKALTVVPLPEYTVNPTAAFRGAVGDFQMGTQQQKISFQDGIPLSLRFALTGSGNFSEIADLFPNWPAPLELIQKHVYLEGQPPFATKYFDYTVAVHATGNLKFQLPDFVYFSPREKRYLAIHPPELNFELMPAPPVTAPVESLRLEPAFQEPTFATAWHKSKVFWILHAFLGLIGIAAVISHKRGEKEESPEPGFHFHLQREIALEAYRNQQTEDFFRIAVSLARDWCLEQLELPKHTLLSEALLCAERRNPPLPELTVLNDLQEAYHLFFFSPEKKLPQPIDYYAEALTFIRPVNINIKA